MGKNKNNQSAQFAAGLIRSQLLMRYELNKLRELAGETPIPDEEILKDVMPGEDYLKHNRSTKPKYRKKKRR